MTVSRTQELDAARALVIRHGWNSTCFQILNPGISLWFSPTKNAVVGYVLRNRVRVVAGAPVCAEGDLAQVLQCWEADATAANHFTCYFGAEGRMKQYLENRMGYSTVTVGAQPSWNPQDWPNIFNRDRSLRAQRSRAAHKGLEVREWGCEEATNHPDLRRCLNEWLTTRGLPPMHFLVEPETLACLEGRRIFVAEISGKVVSFLVLSPIPERRGWLTEQFPRGFGAPNGTVEMLMDFAIRKVAECGALYVTMGLIPLSAHGAVKSSNPPWLNFLFAWIRAHGRRFYNFDGLDRFKLKFRPQFWEPIYVISKEPNFSLRTLYAIASAFSDGPPLGSILRGLSKALQQEVDWFVGKF